MKSWPQEGNLVEQYSQISPSDSRSQVLVESDSASREEAMVIGANDHTNQGSPTNVTQHNPLKVVDFQTPVDKTNFNSPSKHEHNNVDQDSTGEAIQLTCFSKVEDQSNPIEDSTALFENPLQKELDDEIHQQAAQVIQEVSRRGREAKTDLQRPFDPNLVCPMCRKQFRIGEIQKFRRHVNTCTGTDDN